MSGRRPHYTQLLALELARAEDAVTGTAPVRPESFAPGTSCIRPSVLLAMVDLVAGHTPDGPGKPAVGATLDLRAILLAPPPTTGQVHLRCRPLRVGRRFVSAETELFADGAEAPFARAWSTFAALEIGMGIPAGRPPVLPVGADSLDAFLGARVQDDSTLVLDPAPWLANGPVGTVHGGAQALLAELAAEHAMNGRAGGPAPADRLVATDMEVRYLDRLRVGPLTASARPVSSTDGRPVAVVTLRDGGNDDRLVAQATLAFGKL